MSHWLKRHEHCFRSKALQPLQYSWLSELLSVLFEVLLSGVGGTGSASAVGGKPLPKDEKGEWIRNKLKALAKIRSKSCRGFASWILNRAVDVIIM